METITEINIKGMVCNRCISTIQDLLKQNGYAVQQISLGKVLFSRSVEIEKKVEVAQLLKNLGFELISDKNELLLQAIKQAIREWISASEHGLKSLKLSNYLAQKFSKNYDSIGEFFSRYEGRTIEQYFISKRLEKVKELIVYTDLPLSEIAFQTGFSSAYHLSAQFKKNTGMPPSALRTIKKEKSATIQKR
ncbi:helix-turn-helix domain-containing protein [Catalinimonas niigatensis]|uniref:helix-turn-helix domain-containing protein n=1 Tax=Catalinimonas niigatensis TaxID=1397264 RepID=UPI0026669AF2|nr:AraC family transcriptional regulator [Catalinimonas niigatensis]WPP51864.1 AraC family transcriptional regulator [Catalinimonas niigatensis]